MLLILRLLHFLYLLLLDRLLKHDCIVVGEYTDRSSRVSVWPVVHGLPSVIEFLHGQSVVAADTDT